MKTLYIYELRKLLGRRLVWITLAVALALSGLSLKTLVQDALGGRVQALRDVLGRYAGAQLTDALAEQAQREWDAYIATHPDDFNAYGGEDGVSYFPTGYSDYSAGVWEAYNRITNGQTVEDEQARMAYLRGVLDAGRYEDGTALTQAQRLATQQQLAAGPQPDALAYTLGYEQFHTYAQGSGFYLLALLVLVLAPLYAGEGTARMRGVVGSVRRLRADAWARLLAALTVAAALFVLLYGMQLAAAGLTYGFEGYHAPGNTLQWGGANSLPPGPATLTLLGLYLAAALACAAVGAWCSAVFVHPLAALAGGAAAAGAQVLLANWATGSLYSLLFRLIGGRDWLSSLCRFLFKYAGLLPAAVLGGSYSIGYQVREGGLLLPGLALAGVLLLGGALLAVRAFARPGRA